MSSSSPPRGMRDFLPREKARREAMIASIRRDYSSYGFVEVETPYLEDLSRLIGDQGGENEKMLFKVMKRGLTDNDLVSSSAGLDRLCDLGLRYDLTLPLARLYANSRGSIPDVFRCLQIGPVWRAERPQRGRFRQFLQCDIDVIGEPTYLAEVELISVTLKALASLGLEDLTLKVNDRRLLSALMESSGVPDSQWGKCLVSVDKLDKIGLDGVRAELTNYLEDGVVAKLSATIAEFMSDAFDISRLGDLVRSPAVPKLIEHLQRIMVAVSASSRTARVQFDGSLVRGMGYYTGPIFELWHPEMKGAVAGGGRYDGVVGKFLKRDVPACGFSIGFERIAELVQSRFESEVEQVAILYTDSVDWGEVVKAQERCVAAGAICRLVPKAKRLGHQLDTLSEEGVTAWLDASEDLSLTPKALK